ncbi:MAG: CRTAC1 family protein [Verrucomicrobia bacterium]|nr:CRTAC1 family protein [Verrucomicrobiota bacterium]
MSPSSIQHQCIPALSPWERETCPRRAEKLSPLDWLGVEMAIPPPWGQGEGKRTFGWHQRRGLISNASGVQDSHPGAFSRSIRFAVDDGTTRQISCPATTHAAALLCGLLLCFFAAGCSDHPSAPSPREANPAAPDKPEVWFEETAAEAGATFRHSSGASGRFWMPESMCGGVGLLDFDGDGLLDLYCVNGGSLDPGASKRSGNRLYRNLGLWKFEDVTERAGVAGRGEYGMGCACADYDNDGDTDIYVTNVGPNILYRNNGDGTFTDATQTAGVGDASWSTSAAFFDYDGDGHLDLIVANYVNWSRARELECVSHGGLRDYCSPMNYKAPSMDTLYHNKGDGTFENVTQGAGLAKAYGNGLGVGCADFDGDGRLDMFIANDAMPNQLWLNQGNGKFADQAMIRGCAVNSYGVTRAGMGVAVVDLQQDGWLDIFVTHLVGEGNGLFQNRKGYFTDVQQRNGPGSASYPFTGFGVGFADFDHDGNLDLYVANGRVKYGPQQPDPKDPYAEPDTLLRGVGNGEFEELKPQAGVGRPLVATGRGAAFGDLDNDGDIDIAVVNRDGPLHLLRNVAPKRGEWITFRVLRRNRTEAINALLRVEAGSKVCWAQVLPNQSYCSSNDPRVHFGLGPQQSVERVVVRWPDGAEEIFGPFATGWQHEIKEGTGSLSQ